MINIYDFMYYWVFQNNNKHRSVGHSKDRASLAFVAIWIEHATAFHFATKLYPGLMFVVMAAAILFVEYRYGGNRYIPIFKEIDSISEKSKKKLTVITWVYLIATNGSVFYFIFFPLYNRAE